MLAARCRFSADFFFFGGGGGGGGGSFSLTQLSSVASSPFLFKSCKSLIQKKSILRRGYGRDRFIFSRRASKRFQCASVSTSTFGFMAQQLQSIQQMHDDCCRKCQAFFFLFFFLLKPGYSNQQIKVNNRSYA